MNLILDFFHISATLKKIPRQGWIDKLSISNPESVADHTFSMAMMGMIFSDLENYNTEKILKIILLHDLAESITGDMTHEQISKEEKIVLENNVIKKILNNLPPTLQKQYSILWKEYQLNNSEEAKLWINLWVKKGKAKFNDFMIQEYLPGRNLAWDSIWYEGKMIASFTRERLEYPFKHISPSGITGTPTVSRIIIDESINKLGENAVKAIDPMPHGNYAVDLKDDPSGKPCITEIDAGKFHSTTPLWGYISTKILQKEPMKNLPYLYLLLGIGEINPPVLGHDIYPEGLYLLRHIDCGDWLWRENGYKAQIL